MSATDAVEKTAGHVGPHAGLLDWLAANHVEYELHEHPTTYTARETARAEGVDPRLFAKTVGVELANGRRALVVVEATDKVDLVKARHVLDSGSVRLLTEEELTSLAPDCEVGTMPPIGELFDVPVLADTNVREDPEITFHAGSHHFTVHVDRPGWERSVGVTYADLAEARTEPAWSR
jgi:Ala-tRNA(Pro) deacylase